MHHSFRRRGLLCACTLVQRNKTQEKQVGELTLISTPAVCQALCPAPQRHDLIFFTMLRNAVCALSLLALEWYSRSYLLIHGKQRT